MQETGSGLVCWLCTMTHPFWSVPLRWTTFWPPFWFVEKNTSWTSLSTLSTTVFGKVRPHPVLHATFWNRTPLSPVPGPGRGQWEHLFCHLGQCGKVGGDQVCCPTAHSMKVLIRYPFTWVWFTLFRCMSLRWSTQLWVLAFFSVKIEVGLNPLRMDNFQTMVG